jgi:outer membrane protein assembly factor BamB
VIGCREKYFTRRLLYGARVWILFCAVLVLVLIPAGAGEQNDGSEDVEDAVNGLGENKLTISNLAPNAYDFFAQLDKLASEKKWHQYFKTFKKALSLHGEKLYHADEKLFRNFGMALRARVWALPLEAFKAFREYYDTSAKNEFLTWERSRNIGALVKIVEDYFPSSYTDDALAILGSHDFEAGRYTRAASWYRMLIEHYPDPDFSREDALIGAALALTAGGEAKKIIELLKLAMDLGLDSRPCRMLSGDDEPRTMREYLRKLADVAVQRRIERQQSMGDEANWPTYRGNQKRNALAARDIVPGGIVGPYEIRRYDSPVDTSGTGLRGVNIHIQGSPEDYTDCYPFYPVVKDGKVYIPGQYEIGVMSLQTGKRVRIYNSRRGGYSLDDREEKRENNRHFIYTAHLDRDGLYSALATSTFGGEKYRYIDVRGLMFVRDLFSFYMIGRLRWSSMLFTSFSQNERRSIPGTPLRVGDKLISPVYDNSEWTIAGLVAFNARTGRRAWMTHICYNKQELTMFGAQSREPLVSPLAECDGVVYFLTNLGALAAVDGETGRVLWIRTYDEIAIQAAEGYQTIERKVYWQNSSPIILDDLIVFSPLDSRYCYAFELETGDFRWKFNYDEAEDNKENTFNRLVGVSEGKAILSGSAVIALDAQGGKILWRTEMRREHKAVAMGCLSKKYAYIPNASGFNVYEMRNGTCIYKHVFKSTGRQNLKAGNIFIVGDYFITTSKTYATVFRGVPLEEEIKRKNRRASRGKIK